MNNSNFHRGTSISLCEYKTLIIKYLRYLKPNKSLYKFGTCGGVIARKHTINGNVQFVLWKKGDQKEIDGIGHTNDKWVDFDRSWWSSFISN